MYGIFGVVFLLLYQPVITFCMFPAVRSQPQTIPEFYFASPLAERMV